MSQLPLPPLSDRVPVVVVAATVAFRLPLPLSDRVPVALGEKNMLALLFIADVLTLLLMIKDFCRSMFCCCVVAFVSQLPLPLSDCIPVGLVVLGGKGVLAIILIADVLTLLMLIMDC